MYKHGHRFQPAEKKAQSGLMDHLSKKYFFKTIWYMKLKFPGNHYIFKRYTIKVLCILESRRLVLIWDLMAQCLHCAAWTQPHRFFKGPFDKEAEWWSVASDYWPHHLKSKWCGLWWKRRVKEKRPTSARHIWELLWDCWKSSRWWLHEAGWWMESLQSSYETKDWNI